MKEGVVITGIGGVAAIGDTAQAIMRGIASGNRGIDQINSFDSSHFPLTASAEVNGIRLAPGVDKKKILLEQAAEDLFNHCPAFHRYDAEDRVFCLGTGVDYLDLPGYFAEEQWSDKADHLKTGYALAQAFATRYGFEGGVHVNASACVASNQAIGLGYRLLKKRSEKLVIAGGVDSIIDPLGYIGFYKLGALTTWTGEIGESCRPFDRQRCGIVLGEGAALFQLENAARADPACALAEIVGYSTSIDAYLVTDPLPSGEMLAQAAKNAIEEAGISPADIDCVHLHGTGTRKNGIAEANAMRRIFGDRFVDVPVFGLKGQIGHLTGACGAVELLGVIHSLLNQEVPVTVNFEESDPEAPLRVITKQPLQTEIGHVLKLNAAFGGQNAALVLRRVNRG